MYVAHALPAAFIVFNIAEPFRSSINAKIAITAKNTDESSQKVLYRCKYLMPLLMRYAIKKTVKIKGENSNKI